jgi:ribosomal protein S18 acetylase RimI-like enzyme
MSVTTGERAPEHFEDNESGSTAEDPKVRIEIARLMPRHAHAAQRIHQEGRIASQPHGDLAVAHVVAEFRDENSTMEGRTTKQWEDMIDRRLGNNVVFASFVVLDTEDRIKRPGEDTPKSIARASVVDGVNYLRNFYVAPDVPKPRREHADPLFQKVVEHFGEEGFHILTAEHNERAIAYYERLGCVASGASGLGYTMQGVYIPQIELISNPRVNLLH